MYLLMGMALIFAIGFLAGRYCPSPAAAAGIVFSAVLLPVVTALEMMRRR